jgi:alkanesulfonate monooxygenase SsuD/methylene tetrahydromethanopterin reductase-like flavin-dependent oxidoreductase (luciferase family)
MKFHFFHLMPWTTYPEPPVEWPVSNKSFDPVRGQQLYRDYIDCMVYAEECGFDAIGCNEHHYSPYGLMSNCNVIGGALVYRTKKASLAMFGNLVPLLNPIRVAEEYAMLDVMSGGRVIAGFMRGIPHEYIAYNIPPSESRARLREASALILKAWTEPEPFGWEGEFYQFPAVSIWPKPFQQPHPPVLMSASNEESAEFAAAHKAMMGVSLIADLNLVKANIAAYKKAARAHGWEPGPQHILIGEQAVIADTDEEAHELMKGGLDYFHRILMRPQRDAQSLVLEKTRYFDEAGQGERFQKRLATLRSRSFEEQIEAGSILCGSPATVVKQIKRIHDALGMGVVQLIMKIGNLPDAAVRRSLELFRDKVLPEVRGL